MMMKRLEEIFADFMENYDVEDSEVVQQTNQRVMDYLCVLTGNDKVEIEDMISYVGYEHEKQGFMNGFEYALRLREGGVLV